MPADPVLTLASLVLAHLVADFVIQTGGVVAAKNAPGGRGWLGLGAHGLGVAVCLIPIVAAFGLAGFWTLSAVTLAHVVIDRAKILFTRRVERRALDTADARHEGRPPAAGLGRAWTPLPALYFALDQLAHLAVLFAAWLVWLSGQTPSWSSFVGDLLSGRDPAVVHDVVLGIVVVTSLLIANVRGGALFVATLVRPNELGAEIGALSGAAEPPPEAAAPAAGAGAGGRAWDIRIGPIAGRVEEEQPPVRAGGPTTPTPPGPPGPPAAQVGATIGILERLLIVTFVLAGAEVAIGLVVAAKTIARFRLLDDRDFAEYYLLGTLGSVTVAILTGLVAKAALAA
ncbi:MAG TPA: DUF3307 domain-containing protein [Candidatus Limnocylindrales bacterium]|nr:DUF3307 domain-containing protein [Candidatus Limnocylindrales bacterium]